MRMQYLSDFQLDQEIPQSLCLSQMMASLKEWSDFLAGCDPVLLHPQISGYWLTRQRCLLLKVCTECELLAESPVSGLHKIFYVSNCQFEAVSV